VFFLYRTHFLRTLLGLESPAGDFDVGMIAVRSALNVPFNTGLTLEGETVNTFPIRLIAPDAMGVNAEEFFRAEFASPVKTNLLVRTLGMCGMVKL